MGRSRTALFTLPPLQKGKMIDSTNKPPGLVDREIISPQVVMQSQRKHNTVNLPRNVIDSDDEEEYDGECSSEEDGDPSSQDTVFFEGPENNICLKMQELKFSFEQLKNMERQRTMDVLLRNLLSMANEYEESVQETDSNGKALKARSPFRNRFIQHKQKPFEKQNLTVTTPLGNGGRVFFHNLPTNDLPEFIETIPEQNVLLDAIQDKAFLASFKKLTAAQQEQVFLNLLDEGKNNKPEEYLQSLTYSQTSLSPCSNSPVSPYTQSSLSPYSNPATSPFTNSSVSPNTHHTTSPKTSPSIDLYDSSYESGTGSPGSTVVTSPGSPFNHLSPPRSSISSESDQELDTIVENRSIVPTTNILIVPTTAGSGIYNVNMQPKRSAVSNPEQIMKPLGEPVNFVVTSATQRLYDLSKSTSFCVKHFTIQLVRVVMTTKAEKSEDRIKNFSESLLKTMEIKMSGKAHEGDIWQLSIYAHIQFLTAPERMPEYWLALTIQDKLGHSLLYLAAMIHNDKPLIARYIAESMALVSYCNPLQADDQGNTILHLVAEQGDSHVSVLSELLMATRSDSKRLYSVFVTNNCGQTPLHVAVQSSRPHITTVLVLLHMGARPFDQDKLETTALHYHVAQLSKRMPRASEDVELLKKMLKSPMSLSKEDLNVLDKLCTDSSVPSDIISVIDEMRPKKNERR